MYGYFTFEEVEQGSSGLHSEPKGPRFSVRVGRLALSSEGVSEAVPCATIDEAKVPPTSVHATERVFVGALVELATRDEDLRTFTWAVDVQVNNARPEPIEIVGVRWEVVDANGKVVESTSKDLGESAPGVPRRSIKLVPGSALRMKTQLPKVHTPTARISGALIAKFGEAKVK